MLQLSLRPGEYLTIHGDIVVQLAQLSGSRAFLRVEADRSIPIVRGKVLERDRKSTRLNSSHSDSSRMPSSA